MKNNPIYKIAARELKRISEKKSLLLLEITLPVMLFLFFAEVYKTELIHDIPVAIYDSDNSYLSRTLIRAVESSPSLRIIKYDNSVEEIKSDFKQGKIHGAFVIPANFEKDVKSGKRTSLIVYKNSSNILLSNYVLKASSVIIKTISGGILMKKLKSSGMNQNSAMAVINPISIETNSLYNSNYSYENYLVPGVITFIFQMLIMITSVIIINSEYANNTFQNLVDLGEMKTYNIILGKSTPHLLIHLTTAVLIVGIVFPLYDIPIKGSVLSLMVLLTIFIIASFTIGLFISTIINDQLLATEVSVFINTPVFIFSGFTFPIWGMPFLHSFFAQLLPFTHFLNGFLKIYKMGALLNEISLEIFVLLFFVIISTIGTVIGLKKKIKKNLSFTQNDF